MNFLKKEKNFLKEDLWRSKKSNGTEEKWMILYQIDFTASWINK